MIYRKLNFSGKPEVLNLVAIYSEIDDALFEMRKVCVFSDGKMGFADEGRAFGCLLAEGEVQNATPISDDERSKIEVITRAEFEEMWEKAQNSPYPDLSPWKIREL